MDAVKFIKEYSRLCNSYEDCIGCPFMERETNVSCDIISENAEQFVNTVVKWVEEHPRKTIREDFFEKFPNSLKDSSGNPRICPEILGYGQFCCENIENKCTRCWNRPLEE